jgi:hypothetical protein
MCIECRLLAALDVCRPGQIFGTMIRHAATRTALTLGIAMIVTAFG